MLITLKDRNSDKLVTIETEGYDPDDPVIPQIVSDNLKLVDKLEKELNDSNGIYGHLLNTEGTTNLDLCYAVNTLPSFELVSFDQEIVPNPIPEDINT